MSVDQIVTAFGKLSPNERADLVDRLIEEMAISPDPRIEQAQLDEVERRQRTATTFIPGDEVLRNVRQMLDE
jgi:hypothetical protein